MTNSPLAEGRINRPQAFLPIDEAVEVKAGERVKATVMARPAEHLIAGVVEFPTSGGASAIRPGRGCCWRRRT